MAWVDIENNETYASIRAKLNTEVYGKVPLIKVETDKIPAEVTKTAAIKVETDKIPATIVKIDAEVIKTAAVKVETDKIPATITKIDAEVIKTAAIKVETDKIPATITKIDAEVLKTASLVTRTALPTKNSAANATFADVIGNKTDDHTGTSIYSILEVLAEHAHSRSRTYPYLSAGITLTSAAGAYAMGAITEIIPAQSAEIDTLTITHACAVSGFVTIDLNGIKHTVAVTAGDINAVAAELRGYTYDDWVITGSDATVVFTRYGLATTAVLSNLGATEVTGTFVKTNTGAGAHDPFDIHGVQIGLCGNSDTYVLTLYKGLAGYEERICARRWTTTSNTQAGGETPVITPVLAAGERVSASLACGGGGAKTAVISLVYHWYD